VITEEARVEVVGTHFTVERAEIDDHLTTRVEVTEGVVRVTPRTGDPVTLTAGQSWPPPQPPPQVAPAPSDAGVSPSDVVPDAAIEPPPSPPPAPVHPPAHRFDPSVIRSTIRAGKVADARKLIEAGRQAYRGSAATLAELGILSAEADLADRQSRRAIDKYLAVTRDFPATAQAEQALFAAAQLAIDRPDSGYRAKALLEDYLATYPHGQFRKDAERLLGSLH
jgi:ferric-dicitrate binding protein FerR (iron transport regulator)